MYSQNYQIENSMNDFKVADIINPHKLILNCGQNQGIKVGDLFIIYSLTKVVIDPDTKEELERAEIVKGKGKVIHVQNTICTIESTTLQQEARVVREVGGSGIFSSTKKEEVYAPPSIVEFENVYIGDYARRIGRVR